MKTVYMNELTWKEFNEKKDNVVILPIGSTEQHGYHLPLSTDTVIANEIAVKLAEKINGIVAPALSYGYKSKPLSGGGPLFPGTIDLNGNTLINLTLDILTELALDGVKNIFVLNAHFENEAFLVEAIDLFSRQYPEVKIIETNWWDVLPESIINTIFDKVPFPGWALEHAAITETSLMMYLAPHLVRTDCFIDVENVVPCPYQKYPIVKGMVPDSGVLATAKSSSSEKGKLIVDIVLEEFCKIIEKELS